MSNDVKTGNHETDISVRSNHDHSSFRELNDSLSMMRDIDRDLVDRRLILALREAKDCHLYKDDNSIVIEDDTNTFRELSKVFNIDQEDTDSRKCQRRHTFCVAIPEGENTSSSTLTTLRSSFSHQFSKSFDLVLTHLDENLLADLEAEDAAEGSDSASPRCLKAFKGNSYYNEGSPHNSDHNDPDSFVFRTLCYDRDDGKEDDGIVAYWNCQNAADFSDGAMHDSLVWEEGVLRNRNQQTLNESRRSLQDSYFASLFEEEGSGEQSRADIGIQVDGNHRRKRRVSFNLTRQDEWSICNERLSASLSNLGRCKPIIDVNSELEHTFTFSMDETVYANLRSVQGRQKYSDEKKLVSALKKVSNYVSLDTIKCRGEGEWEA